MSQPSHSATSAPSAIYVWLVPSEEVLEQPGSWRIRKWDTAPFPEANFTAVSETGTKIWAAEGGWSYEGYTLIGVYPTKDAAEAAAKANNQYERTRVTECTLGVRVDD